MYLKIIHSNGKEYYLLCVKDSKKDNWVERFVNENTAQVLIKLGIKTKLV